MHYRFGGNSDPAKFMGGMILRSPLSERNDDIEDILPYRYDEITLPMLGAALFKRGWVNPTFRYIRPIDTPALGDIGYVTEADTFVVVENVHHRLRAESGLLSWDGKLESKSGRKSLDDAPAEGIVSEGGNVYYRRRQVYSLFKYPLTVTYSRLCALIIPAQLDISTYLGYQNLDEAHAYKLLQRDARSIIARRRLSIAPHDLRLSQSLHTFRTTF